MDTTLADPLLGVVLDQRYRVDAVLAHGGMSTVYHGWDLRLDRAVAIKVMSPSFAGDPAFVQQFGREARTAARLSHPGVVPVYDQGQDGGHVFLVMELVRGHTLRQLLRQRGRLGPEVAVSVLEPVLDALAAAHRAGLVHRDVKPENVLIGADGTVKVADFGLARAVATAAATQTTTIMGTVAYVAPEQVSRGTADARTDVYSAGILLYEMLTGAPPYLGDTAISVAYRHVHEDVPAPSLSATGVPAALDELVLAATSRAPAGRPADAGAFLAELRQVRSECGLAPVAVPTPKPTASSARTPTADSGERREDLSRTRTLQQPPLTRTDRTSTVVTASRQERATAVPPRDEQRAHRRRGVIGLVVVLMLGLGAAGAGWSYGIWRYTDVPSLKGMTRSAAIESAQKAHLKVRSATTTVFDDDVRPGLVAGTKPGEGRRIARNGTVTLLISKGPAPREIPNLAGKSADEAMRALTGLKLTPRLGKAFADTDEGRVAGTDPAAGESVRRGAEVTVLVSRGRLPDGTGQRRSEAVEALEDLGLDVRVREDYSDDVDSGTVIRQDPSHGLVRSDDRITLYVSKGPESVRVPRVIGDSLDDARRKLEGAGFKVKVRTLLGAQTDRVAAQSPLPGLKRAPGTTVTLQVV